MRTIAFAGAAALALFARPAPASQFVVVAGTHFRVLCHFDDAKIAEQALATAESVWPIATELYGVRDAPPDPLLDVHLYRDAAAYASAERSFTEGRFARNLAFTHYDTRSSHVAVQPDLTDEALAVVGLNGQTRHQIAHEATHLVSHLASPDYRRYPEWFSEGSAMWVAQEAMTSRGWSAGAEEDPFLASAMVLAKKLLAGGELPRASDVLRGGAAPLERYRRYAAYELFFRRLVSRRDAKPLRAAFVRALRSAEGGGVGERLAAAVTTTYAAEGPEGLDLDFEQYVRSRAPAWDEVFRALSTVGPAWAHTAFAENNALAWRAESAGDAPYEVRGEIEILPGKGKAQQANVLLGRDVQEGFVSVAFKAGEGVTVLRYHAREDRWETLARGAAAAVQVWRKFPFRIAVEKDRVTVRVEGAEPVAASLGGRSLAGPWGLGVQAGAAVLWRGVRLRPLAK